MDVSSHTTLLPAGAAVPEWVQLLPAGKFLGRDGRGPYEVRSPKDVIEASMVAGKLPIDENHSTQRAPELGNPSPARGWIVQLDARADGVWGRVEWNEAGHAMMTRKEYRGISPVFAHGSDGTVTRLISAALTNSPNLPQLAALNDQNPNTQTGAEMDTAKIAVALGLAAGADEAAILAALAAKDTTIAAHSAELTSMQATSAPVGQVVALQTQITTMENERKAEKAETFVDAAIAAGKALVPVRAQIIAMHVADPAKAQEFVDALPSVNAGGTGGGAGGTAAHDMQDGDISEMDAKIYAKMGISRADAAKALKAKAKEGSAA